MAILLARQPLVLGRGTGRQTILAPVALAAQTESITLRLWRPTTLEPLAWGVLDRVAPAIVLNVDGVEYRCQGRAIGGVRVNLLTGREVDQYLLRYTLPVGFFGMRSGSKRLGETASQWFRGLIELILLDGAISTDIEVVSTEQPAPVEVFRSSVAFDTATDVIEEAGDNVVSLTHTAGGSNTAVFAGVSALNLATPRPGGGTVTYGGTGMTNRWDVGDGGNTMTNDGFSLAGPASGAQTVTSTITGTTPDQQYLGVMSLTGVDQTTPVGTGVSAAGTASPATVTVASVGVDDLVVDNLYTDFPIVTADADQTVRNTEDGIGQPMRLRQSTQPGTAGGVMSWTLSGTQPFGIGWLTGAIAFEPAAAAKTPWTRWPLLAPLSAQ